MSAHILKLSLSYVCYVSNSSTPSTPWVQVDYSTNPLAKPISLPVLPIVAETEWWIAVRQWQRQTDSPSLCLQFDRKPSLKSLSGLSVDRSVELEWGSVRWCYQEEVQVVQDTVVVQHIVQALRVLGGQEWWHRRPEPLPRS
jgi:hypothetical protein